MQHPANWTTCVEATSSQVTECNAQGPGCYINHTLHNTFFLSNNTDLRLAYPSHRAPDSWQATVEQVATHVTINQLQTNRAHLRSTTFVLTHASHQAIVT